MKKLLLLLLIAPVLVIAQGVQRYADGTATDQEGNTFEWINYGNQVWAIENVKVVTYRDGTPIPQVTDATEWGSLTTGAWCYYNNDPTKQKLYNWYAIAGIHDAASLSDASQRKEFAPEGWHVPTDAEWTILEEYLIENGYNYDGATEGNKIAKSIASNTGWTNSNGVGCVGYEQSTNNTSGFNALPVGYRWLLDSRDYIFSGEGEISSFWTSSGDFQYRFAEQNFINYNLRHIGGIGQRMRWGIPVRLVTDLATLSTKVSSNALTIYPNPTTSILTIEGNKEYQIKVYDLLGNKVLETQGNSVNMQHLSTATYIVKATDKSNNEELTYKVVKN